MKQTPGVAPPRLGEGGGSGTRNVRTVATLFFAFALNLDRRRYEGGKTPGAANAPGEATPRRGLLKAPGGDEDKRKQANNVSRCRAGGTRVGRGVAGLGEGATATAF